MQLGRVHWANAELLARQAKDAMRRLKLTTLKLRLTCVKSFTIISYACRIPVIFCPLHNAQFLLARIESRNSSYTQQTAISISVIVNLIKKINHQTCVYVCCRNRRCSCYCKTTVICWCTDFPFSRKIVLSSQLSPCSADLHRLLSELWGAMEKCGRPFSITIITVAFCGRGLPG